MLTSRSANDPSMLSTIHCRISSLDCLMELACSSATVLRSFAMTFRAGKASRISDCRCILLMRSSLASFWPCRSLTVFLSSSWASSLDLLADFRPSMRFRDSAVRESILFPKVPSPSSYSPGGDDSTGLGGSSLYFGREAGAASRGVAGGGLSFKSLKTLRPWRLGGRGVLGASGWLSSFGFPAKGQIDLYHGSPFLPASFCSFILEYAGKEIVHENVRVLDTFHGGIGQRRRGLERLLQGITEPQGRMTPFFIRCEVLERTPCLIELNMVGRRSCGIEQMKLDRPSFYPAKAEKPRFEHEDVPLECVVRMMVDRPFEFFLYVMIDLGDFRATCSAG